MNVPDLNILLYAYNRSAPIHGEAVRWWEDQLNTAVLVGIPWVVLLGFLRLLSGRQLVEKPYRTEELFRIVQEWTSLPNVRLLAESPTTLQILADLCIRHSISGCLLTNACIVAQVLEFEGTLFTNDSDFVVFSEIVPVNPL